MNYMYTMKYLFLRLWCQHQLWPHGTVKFLLAQSLELHCTLFERRTLLVSVLGNLGGHVVTNDWVQTCYKH